MNARRTILALGVIAVVSGAWTLSTHAQGPVGPGAAAPPKRTPIALVGPDVLSREDLDRRATAAAMEFAQRNGNRPLPPEMKDIIRRQVLEGMIRLQLLALEAKRTGVTTNPLEAEEILKQDPFFNPGGKFDPQRFLAIKTTQTPAFTAAIAAVQQQLAARKLNAQLEARFRGDDAALRASAEHELSRVTLEHFSLRRNDFTGLAPEPRELDVQRWYEAHRAEYARNDRATITVAFVNTPALDDSTRKLPDVVAAWTRRMKSVADSLLAVVKSGADFKEATGFLGPRPDIVVTSDNFPGYWRGGDALNARIFDPRGVGKVFPEPVPAAEGWLLVQVNDVVPAHVAPIREVAREIRGVLRRERRAHAEEEAQRALFAVLRDSLAAPGWRVRYAVADSSVLPIAPPTDDELDRWYRGHLADYSSFDSRTSAIVAKPLADVKADVRARWLVERKATQARLLADQVARAWAAGKRDPASEGRLQVREPAPAPEGAIVDTTLAARPLSDSLWATSPPRPSGTLAFRRGWIVWQVLGRVDRVTPTFEQARGQVAQALQRRRDAEDEAGARKLFDANPSQFDAGRVLHFSRFTVPQGKPLGTPLTRAEVEKWHRDHIDKYSAPELVRAKHILVSPKGSGADAERAAREKAQRILDLLRAGASFDSLARADSDDPATRDKGGDLGVFGRGSMLDAFERAAFALSPGDFAPEPVRTEVGYHVIYCVTHDPAVVQPLPLVYTIVASDAAAEKAEVLAEKRADSLIAACRTIARARAAAGKLGFTILSYTHRLGTKEPGGNVQAYFDGLEKLAPGQLAPKAFRMKGVGSWVTWADSITAPISATWDEARSAALDQYRRGAGQRALEAKRAEIDSLAAGGWSLDSLAALWAGPEKVRDLPSGRGLSGLGGATEVDSLAFGTAHAKPVELMKFSNWLTLPSGFVRVRVLERTAAAPDQVAARVENLRARQIESHMSEYFEGLRRRWVVKILDAKLRDVALVGPPATP